MRIGISRLRSDLSRILALAQAGEEIEVTSHNRPIARIVGIPDQGCEGLRRLLASGQATWSGGKPTFTPPIKLSPSGKRLSQMVLEDRG